jgi:hypothetical protein
MLELTDLLDELIKAAGDLGYHDEAHPDFASDLARVEALKEQISQAIQRVQKGVPV